ncbi:MAG: acetyltransferase [Nitrospirae bacterium GWD2_57_9]|nr:MAG: acetyltransferase [Nitrospirae bacterium GWD2_57_9]OGW50243.1 MAG: acetyltransferase [Nitrospirae bacterium GWC2_57_9]
MSMRRCLQGVVFYLANHVVMNQPFYGVRHWFLRLFCRIEIGADSSIHMGCFITGSNIKIGNNTVINRQTYLDGRAGLTIGSNVNISHQTLIQTLTHDPQDARFGILRKPVVIADHVWIGSRALILPGVTIGEGAVIGAGSVVTRDIPPYTIAVGNPAKVIKTRNRNLEYETRYFPYFDTDIQ